MAKIQQPISIRSKFYLNIEFSLHWDDELKEMNKGKRGAKFKFSDSFIK
ncbi:MAG: hypothetical protein QXW67_03650 [Candidatus Micrarchaeia archaeon]